MSSPEFKIPLAAELWPVRGKLHGPRANVGQGRVETQNLAEEAVLVAVEIQVKEMVPGLFGRGECFRVDDNLVGHIPMPRVPPHGDPPRSC